MKFYLDTRFLPSILRMTRYFPAARSTISVNSASTVQHFRKWNRHSRSLSIKTHAVHGFTDKTEKQKGKSAMKSESQLAYKKSITSNNNTGVGKKSNAALGNAEIILGDEDDGEVIAASATHRRKFKRIKASDVARFTAQPKKCQTADARKPAAGTETQRPVQENVAASPSIKLDKLTLAVLMDELSDDETEVVNKCLQRWKKEKKLIRGSPQGKGFKNVFLGSFEDGFSIEIRVNPSRLEHAKQFMNFTFNPARMSEKRAKWFIMILTKLFPGRWQEILRGLRLYRVDVCADLPVDVNSLIVRQRRGVVESKFFVATDSVGRVQTIYLGSIESEVHGVVYDQNASDEYKRRVGEPISLPSLEWSRSKAEDDAEVVIKRTRFEVRRIFKDLPDMSALEEWTAPFDRWDVWQIKDVPKLRKDAAFWAYIDVVRWRGVAGARKYLSTYFGTGIDRFEKMLNNFKTDWWTSERLGLDVRAAFHKSRLWGLLNE